MTPLLKKLGLVTAATAIGTLVCCAVAYFSVGGDGAVQALSAGVLSWSIGLVVMGMIHTKGATDRVIIMSMFLRLGFTAGIGYFLALRFESLRSISYFLSLAALYMVNLTIETWLTFIEIPRTNSSTDGS